ncbi:hypothetical protein PRUB_a1480 [Pseudoalteromonas rubra]|uniref:START domain-containing protein n=1 Tax=Pseudoalteromonas rubra TaxID=43658 RepID=A0A8T0C840_9GAMM|nr:START domain-containing protein [Pseudoalteromonas rubra]KAF7786813.1 hypothetical protein PRUB_a1480 [Pseudoalteromonas rubra]
MNPTGNTCRLACPGILLWLVCFAASGHSAQSQISWQPWHHSSLFSISYQKLPDQPMRIRVTGKWPGVSAKSVINLLHDTTRVSQWVKHVSAVTILSRPAPSQALVLTHFDLPWPLRKRDMVTHACLLQKSPASYELKIRSVAEYPSEPGMIRIEPVIVQWVLTERDNAVEIDYQISADIQGDAPQWFVDKVALRNTRISFNALHALLPVRMHNAEGWAITPANTCPFE